MQVSSNGKVRRSAAEWTEILARFAASGLSGNEFCRAEKLSHASFQRWQRKLPSPKQAFVEVATIQQDPSSWTVEIEFASGTTLRLRG